MRALLVAVLLGGVLAACTSDEPPTPLADGAAPSLVATPATGLVDGDDLRVDGSGWPPDVTLAMARCETGTARCAPDRLRVTTDATGALRVDLAAATAFVSGQGDPVDCRVVACELRVEWDPAPVAAPLGFDPEAPLGPQPALAVRPSAGLVDGQRVAVRAEHLDPAAHVGFALCAAGARSAFDDRCHVYDAGLLEEEHAGEGRPVGDDGAVVADLVVYADAYAYDRRVDCRVEACELVVTSVGAVLARAPVTFDRRAALRGPARLAVSPATGLAAGDTVEVRGSGFYAGEPVLVEQCAADSTAETCVAGPSERWTADDEGRLSGTFTVRRRAATDHQAVDCLAVDCVLRADRSAFVPAASRSVEAPVVLER